MFNLCECSDLALSGRVGHLDGEGVDEVQVGAQAKVGVRKLKRCVRSLKNRFKVRRRSKYWTTRYQKQLNTRLVLQSPVAL